MERSPLHAQLKVIRALPVFAGTRLARRPCRLRLSKRTPPYMGEAFDRGAAGADIVVYAIGGSAAQAATLLHEATHASGLWGHGGDFRRRFVRAAAEAYPEVVPFRWLAPVAPKVPVQVLDEIVTAGIVLAHWWRSIRGA